MHRLLPSTRFVIFATWSLCAAAIIAGRAGQMDIAQAMMPLCALGFWLISVVALREGLRWRFNSTAGNLFRYSWITAVGLFVVAQPLLYLRGYFAE